MNFENGMYLVLLFFFEGCGGRGGGGGGGGAAVLEDVNTRASAFFVQDTSARPLLQNRIQN